jgi:hypothetical protein
MLQTPGTGIYSRAFEKIEIREGGGLTLRTRRRQVNII